MKKTLIFFLINSLLFACGDLDDNSVSEGDLKVMYADDSGIDRAEAGRFLQFIAKKHSQGLYRLEENDTLFSVFLGLKDEINSFSDTQLTGLKNEAIGIARVFAPGKKLCFVGTNRIDPGLGNGRGKKVFVRFECHARDTIDYLSKPDRRQFEISIKP
ncbi:MAG: hypothetical protein H7Y04_05475 [Verrucomicrobia bacterium]|nr:hypothetical protein [Cytophagales bacterium]